MEWFGPLGVEGELSTYADPKKTGVLKFMILASWRNY